MSWIQRMARNHDDHRRPRGEEKRRGPSLAVETLHLADETYDLAPEPGGVESTQVMPIQCHCASCGVIEALQQGSNCGLSWREGGGVERRVLEEPWRACYHPCSKWLPKNTNQRMKDGEVPLTSPRLAHESHNLARGQL